jgi:CBS domain containing-hemolysin-like protein
MLWLVDTLWIAYSGGTPVFDPHLAFLQVPVFTILLVASLTLIASLSCSLFEAVLYSITPTQIELLKHRKVSGANRLQRLRKNIEEPITAILTLNTIAHTLGAAWCGAIVAREYGDNAVGTFVAIFTFLLLIFTEIIPKSIGVRFAQKLGPYCAWPIQVMTWVTLPVARPAQFLMRRLMGGGEPEGPTETEVILFSRLAAAKGSVREEEHRWIENALRLDKLVARDIRTPQTVVEVLASSTLVSELRYSKLVHSRIPVVDGDDPERLKGLVYRRELFDAIAQGGDESRRVQDLMHPIHFVPETIPAHTLLSKFVSERRHMVAVTNKQGGFEGVVTLEDVLECMLGEEIVDEHDEHSDMQQHARDTATPGDEIN